jgi:hypothetical protein
MLIERRVKKGTHNLGVRGEVIPKYRLQSHTEIKEVIKKKPPQKIHYHRSMNSL